MKSLYAISSEAGLALVVWVYVFRFDSMSETELLQHGPLWLLPLAFGLYGLAAEKAIQLVIRGEAATLAMATLLLLRHTSVLLGIVLLPFLLVSSRRSSLVALCAVAFWYGVYVLITQALWHLL